MLADCDAFAIDPKNGRLCIIEAKTTHSDAAKHKWGDANSNTVPIDYEWQGRHYMAVTGCSCVIYIALTGFGEGDYRQRFILRDLDKEAELIEEEARFWEDYVEQDVEPPFTEKADQVKEAMKKFYGKQQGIVKLGDKYSEDFTKWLQLDEQRKEMEKKAKNIKAMQDTLMNEIEDELKGRDGEIETDNGKYQIKKSIMKKSSIPAKMLNSLRLNYPNVYDEFVTTSSSLRTSVKRVG